MDPIVSGVADLSYLREALARAGASSQNATELVTESLTDGRMGAAVTRLQTRAAGGASRSFVLKVVPSASWRAALGLDHTEARLWLHGATRTLPAGLRCPTIDVARHATREEWWLLMEDVSSGIVPRGTFDETRAEALMRNIARMHARYWERDQELSAFPLASMDAVGDATAALNVYVARGDTGAEPWLESMNQDFSIVGVLLPALLDSLRSEDADFFIQLCSDHARISRALAKYPRTFVHADLRRANIAFVGDDVVLFDWERATSGPAARDVQWYWFLQFWAYPPDDGRTLADRQGLLDRYLDSLERERGCKLDRAQFDESCEVSWLSVFCQIGFCLADPLTGASPTAETVARAKRVIADAIDFARRIQDQHVR